VSDVVREIANAVLYEGHMLFPYTPSAVKNRQRWTFGGVHPVGYARLTNDRSRVSFQCLVEGRPARIAVEVRFLQIVAAGDRDEAVERSLGVGAIDDGLLQGRVAMRFDRGRLTVTIENRSDWTGADRREAMYRTFASTHVVARVEDGAFVSATETAESLEHEGLWPVLVGEAPDRSTLLAAPIILPDYPRVAPESPGDFFDGCEIDGLLALSILGLSDDERREALAGDPRAREIVERTGAMTPEELRRLHGTWRR
jgi:hypothetical protein